MVGEGASVCLPYRAAAACHRMFALVRAVVFWNDNLTERDAQEIATRFATCIINACMSMGEDNKDYPIQARMVTAAVYGLMVAHLYPDEIESLLVQLFAQSLPSIDSAEVRETFERVATAIVWGVPA